MRGVLLLTLVFLVSVFPAAAPVAAQTEPDAAGDSAAVEGMSPAPAAAAVPSAPAAASAAPAPSAPAAAANAPSAMENYHTGRDLEARNRAAEAASYYNEAIRICQNEVARNAATRDTYTAITWTLQRQNRYAEVISWGERGLRLFPNEFRIVETMGEAYFYLGDYRRSLAAMQRYTNAIARGERSSVAYFFTGEIYRLTQKYHHADIAYTTAVHLEPGLALWWYRLATVREAAGDKAAAAEAYREALRLNPNHREAQSGLSRAGG